MMVVMLILGWRPSCRWEVSRSQIVRSLRRLNSSTGRTSLRRDGFGL